MHIRLSVPFRLTLLALLARRGLEPVCICESAGTQAEDAAEMKRLYRESL